MVKYTLRVLRVIAGVLLVIVGIIGCFLPIIQGMLLIALGLVVLSYDIPAARRLKEWAERRFREERAKLAERRARRKAARASADARETGEPKSEIRNSKEAESPNPQ